MTDKQSAFIRRLIATRQHTERYGDLDLDALSVPEASAIIDQLLALPERARPANAIRYGQVIDGQHTVSDTASPAAVDPDVPAGRYAIGDGEALRFYKVDRPTDGRWAGRTFVSVQASDDWHPVRDYLPRRAILAAIAADQPGALRRYGLLIGACGHCGRTLTDPVSIAYGIGPVCRARLGMEPDDSPAATITGAEPTDDGRTLWTIAYGSTPVGSARL